MFLFFCDIFLSIFYHYLIKLKYLIEWNEQIDVSINSKYEKENG